MGPGRPPARGALTRRQLLQGAAGAAALTPLPVALSHLGGRTTETPPGFPAGIGIARKPFQNWATSLDIPGLWTATPKSAAEVLEIVNWAHRRGWKVRARGAMHGWSPLTVTSDTNAQTPTVLVDTSGLAHAKLVSRAPAAVRVGAGITMLDLLSFLESHGLGLTSVPATGAPTIGGVLAIGGHGAALPAAGEPDAHRAFGSVSNLVLELTAVVWSPRARAYVLRRFARHHPDAAALLVSLGRTFITEVTLRAFEGQNLRCQSFTDIPASELFARPGSSARTFESYVAQAGRVEAIWYPFTSQPWLKVWSVSPAKPAASRAVRGPYNYPFSDQLPLPVAELARRIIVGDTAVAPELGLAQYLVTVAGLAATNSTDLWGPAKNTQLYIRPSTLRYDELGYSVLTRRKHLQGVINLVANKYSELLNSYRAQNRFPINGPLEIRCCSVDRASVIGVHGAKPPALAATAPRHDHRKWDTLVWTNVLTFTGTAGKHRFYGDLERWMLSTFDGTWASPRQEWSKGWALTDTAAWAHPRILKHTIPKLYTDGRPPDGDWAWALHRLHALDPHHVFSNGFLRAFLH